MFQDLRYGWRALMKNPGFAWLAVITLALGIGANTAIFSIVNSLLLQSLPYENPDRLVMVWGTNLKMGQARDVVSGPNFTDFDRQNTVFENMAAFEVTEMTARNYEEGAGIIPRLEVTPDFFHVLGVSPFLGRAFTPEDGTKHNNLVVIGYEFWRRRFGGDPQIIGKTLAPIGQTHTIVGVLPERFRFFHKPDVVTLLSPEALAEQGRTSHHYWIIARLKDQNTVSQADAELDGIMRRIAGAFPGLTGWEVTLDPLESVFNEPVRPALLVLFGAVAMVLLIACANVANLLTSRGLARRREFAIRAAVGASRVRLVRQLLTESCLLAVIGGALGLLLAVWVVNLSAVLAPAAVSIQNSAAQVELPPVQIDSRTLGFTALLSLLTVFLFGLTTAFNVSLVDVQRTLKNAAARATAGRGRMLASNFLILAETALATLLLIGTGLMLRTVANLLKVDPGFQTKNVLTMYVGDLNEKPLAERAVYYDQVIRQVSSLPGVLAAGFNDYVPLQNEDDYVSLLIEGRPRPEPGAIPREEWRRISPGYFQAAGVRLLSGRHFTEADDAGAESVVIINQAMARKYWPGANPIGQYMRLSQRVYASPKVVGIVGDERFVRIDQAAKPLIYAPYHRQPRPLMALFVKTGPDANAMLPDVQRAVWSVDKAQPIFNVNTLKQIVADSISVRRLTLSLIAALAIIALLMSAVGIYGVISQSVSQRTSEIGIRMALGAQRRDIFRLIISQSMRAPLIGIGFGLVGAMVLTRYLASLLFGVAPTDAVTFVGVSSLLAAVTLLSCYVPARRATRVDPLISLKCE